MPTSPLSRRLILPALLLVLIALPLGYAGAEIWRWLDEQHATGARIGAEEHRLQPVRRRFHVQAAVVTDLAAGRITLLEAAAWERTLGGLEDAEQCCRLVLRGLAEYARVSESAAITEALRREQGDLECLLAGFAPLVLPKPPELPGLSP